MVRFFLMDVDAQFDIIKVPLTWAGMTRELEDGRRVWTCGGCLDADHCAEGGVCIRSKDRAMMPGDD